MKTLFSLLSIIRATKWHLILAALLFGGYSLTFFKSKHQVEIWCSYFFLVVTYWFNHNNVHRKDFAFFKGNIKYSLREFSSLVKDYSIQGHDNFTEWKTLLWVIEYSLSHQGRTIQNMLFFISSILSHCFLFPCYSFKNKIWKPRFWVLMPALRNSAVNFPPLSFTFNPLFHCFPILNWRKSHPLALSVSQRTHFQHHL